MPNFVRESPWNPAEGLGQTLMGILLQLPQVRQAQQQRQFENNIQLQQAQLAQQHLNLQKTNQEQEHDLALKTFGLHQAQGIREARMQDYKMDSEQALTDLRRDEGKHYAAQAEEIAARQVAQAALGQATGEFAANPNDPHTLKNLGLHLGSMTRDNPNLLLEGLQRAIGTSRLPTNDVNVNLGLAGQNPQHYRVEVPQGGTSFPLLQGQQPLYGSEKLNPGQQVQYQAPPGGTNAPPTLSGLPLQDKGAPAFQGVFNRLAGAAFDPITGGTNLTQGVDMFNQAVSRLNLPGQQGAQQPVLDVKSIELGHLGDAIKAARGDTNKISQIILRAKQRGLTDQDISTIPLR